MYPRRKRSLITWLLVFVMFCVNMLPAFAQDGQITESVKQSITLHFKKPADWQDTVKVHYWGRKDTQGAEHSQKETGWPGSDVSERDGDWYTYTFEDTSFVNVIFNDANGKQTANIKEVTSQIFGEGWVIGNRIYSFNPDGLLEDNEITVHVQKPSSWKEIKIHANTDVVGRTTFQAITLDVSDNVWYTETFQTSGPAIEFKFEEEGKRLVPKGTQNANFMTTSREVWVTSDGMMHLNKPTITEEPKVERTAPTLVKLHFYSPDNDYEGWNIHTWVEGQEGRQVEFIGQDKDGLYAVLSFPDIVDKVGFIVKRNGWEKHYEGDLFVDTSKGNQEIFVTSGSPDFTAMPIQYNYENVKVNVNYRRMDGNYDGWNLWMWTDNGDGEVAFTQDSEDDKIAIANFTNMKGQDKVGLIVRKGNWEAKDPDVDRYIDLAYANANGEVTIYLLQGDPNVYYGKIVPCITSAQLNDDFASVSFRVNVPLADESGIELWNTKNKEKIGATVTLDSSVSGVIKATEGELDITIPYEVTIPGYGKLAVGLHNIYSTKRFEQLYTYDGELGAIYSEDKTTFKLWAPTATEVKVKLFDDGNTGGAKETYDMVRRDRGVWSYTASGDLDGTYYTYEVTVGGKTVEAVDPYAKTAGLNGKRGMVINLSRVNPTGWKANSHHTVENPTDAIIYELHVRDLSMQKDSGIQNKGKFIGLIEEGTKNSKGTKTGLDHIKELGVTHVHLLPSYDYLSVDESRSDQFNWGYDPQNYNVPEGSYSTNPSKGEVRVQEFKQMVKGFHDNNIGVIMDVVYNHLGGDAVESNFDLIVPGYYFRMKEDGGFANGSGCGNETASERSMVRKFMVDSVTYWASEYNVDGFRFDLMGLHDIETMNLIRAELDRINPKILMYGEGWTGGDTPLPEEDRALKKNIPQLDARIAAFSDDIRDGLKGSVFNEKETAFVNGTAKDAQKAAESIKFGVVASTNHPQVDYSKVNYSDAPWANEPTQTVTYVSAHDNHTLWDKIRISAPEASEFEQIRMDKFATAVILTSQGMPFIHAGEEMLRTKGGDHNSYKSPDSVNQLDWTRKDKYPEVFEYYKGLIELRKSHPAFRMPTTELISNNLTFLDMPSDSMVGYELNGKKIGDEWDRIIIIHNGSKQFQSVQLDGEDWITVVDSEYAGVTALARYQGNIVQVTPNSTHVFVDKASYEKTAPQLDSKDITIYVQNRDDWDAPYIWFGKDGKWEMNGLGEEPSIMEKVEEQEGWYKKQIKEAKEIEFLFNNGQNWDTKIAQQVTNQNLIVMTKVAWVTNDGRLYTYNPVLYPEKEDSEEDEEPQPEEWTVSFKVPEDWGINEDKPLHMYYWSAEGEAFKWPGKKVEEPIGADGWVTVKVPNLKNLKIIFNNNEGKQTADLGVWSPLWISDNTSYPYHPEKDTAIFFRKPADWSEAYFYSWEPSVVASWPGAKMVQQKDSTGKATGWYLYAFKNTKGKIVKFNVNDNGRKKDGNDVKSGDLSTNKTCWIDEKFNIYDYEPSMTLSVDANSKNMYAKYFKDEASVKIAYSGANITTAVYTLDGTEPSAENGITFKNNDVIKFGKDLKVGDTITLKVLIDNGNMQQSKELTYTKMKDVVVDKTAFNNLRTYQIMVAPYRDGDKDKGYGVGYGVSHNHGDLKGITEALPYIKDLGMNAIWLTPIFKSEKIGGQDIWADKLDATGYFCTNYFEIDPNFGTLEEAKELVKQAHDLGIYVFLDGVFGHHKAGVDIPASPSGYKIIPGKGAETHNPVHYDEETLNFYKEVATYWIDELEIDGWRMDQCYQVSIPMQDDNYWRQIREAVEEKCAQRKAEGKKWGTLGYLVGEDWDGEETIQYRTYGPDFAPGLHSAFDFPGRYRLVQVLAGEEWVEEGKYNQPASKLGQIFETHEAYANHAVPNLMIGNHDLLRFGDLIQRAPHLGYGKEHPDYWKRHKAAISFLASYTGPITLYYGEEIGMECENYVNGGDEVPGYGQAWDDQAARLAGRIPTDGTGFTDTEKDLYSYTQKVMKLRSENPALWNGTRTHLFSTETQYADLKQAGDSKVVYLLNTGTQKDTFVLDASSIGKGILVDGITAEKIGQVDGKYTVSMDGLSARFLIVQKEGTPSTEDTPSAGGGGSAVPMNNTQRQINQALERLKDSKDVAATTKTILASIDQLDTEGAKEVAKVVVTELMTVAKEAKDVSAAKEAAQAAVQLVEALAKQVATNKVELQNGKATLAGAKVAEQVKAAKEIIDQLQNSAKDSKVELGKVIMPTVHFALDKEAEAVSITIPADVWRAVGKDANVAIQAIGTTLVLEHNTFKEQDYTLNIKVENGIVDLTTNATFTKPVTVAFPVDPSVKRYPTVFHIVGGKEIPVGGIYDLQTQTVKTMLSHFSLYTVKEGTPKAFTDLGEVTWERKAIDELSAKGYIVGMSETSYAPSQNMTRAQFAAMLTRAVLTIETNDTVGYSDVKQGAWYYNSVVTAVNQGWLVGVGENQFAPNAIITRQEVAAVLSRLLAQKGYVATQSAPEGVNVATWAKNAVSLYLREVDEKELHTLDMSQAATRAEVAVMMYELLNK